MTRYLPHKIISMLPSHWSPRITVKSLASLTPSHPFICKQSGHLNCVICWYCLTDANFVTSINIVVGIWLYNCYENVQ